MISNRIKLFLLLAIGAGGVLAFLAAVLSALFDAPSGLFELLWATAGALFFVGMSLAIVGAIRRRDRIVQMLTIYGVICVVFPLAFLPERFHPWWVQRNQPVIMLGAIVIG